MHCFTYKSLHLVNNLLILLLKFFIPTTFKADIVLIKLCFNNTYVHSSVCI